MFCRSLEPLNQKAKGGPERRGWLWGGPSDPWISQCLGWLAGDFQALSLPNSSLLSSLHVKISSPPRAPSCSFKAGSPEPIEGPVALEDSTFTECENVCFLHPLSSLPHSGCFISGCFLIRLAAREKVEVGKSAFPGGLGGWLAPDLRACGYFVTLSSLREEPAVALTLGANEQAGRLRQQQLHGFCPLPVLQNLSSLGSHCALQSPGVPSSDCPESSR